MTNTKAKDQLRIKLRDVLYSYYPSTMDKSDMADVVADFFLCALYASGYHSTHIKDLLNSGVLEFLDNEQDKYIDDATKS